MNHPQYYQALKRLFNTSIVAYWPLSETTGVTALDLSGNGLNGTYRNTAGTLNGVTLAQPGAEPGGKAAYFDGTNGYCNIYSAGLASAFNGAEGSMIIWTKADSIFTDNTDRIVFRVRVDVNNRIEFVKGVNNVLQIYVVIGGTAHGWVLTNTTDWTQLIFTWSKSGNKTYVYQNGNQIGDPSTCETWAGALAANANCIGAGATTPASFWKGRAAHGMILNRPITQSEVRKSYNLNF
jgi:hypothetical protein